MRHRKWGVRLLRAAEDDLYEIVSYVAAENPDAAEALAGRIEKSLAYLSHNPLLGRVPAEEQLAGLGYRYHIVDNYLVFYIVEKKTLFVHRIIHGARDYRKLL